MSPKEASGVIEIDYTLNIIPTASILIAALFNLSFPQNTLLEFETIMANAPVWPGTQETSLGDVSPDSLITTE